MEPSAIAVAMETALTAVQTDVLEVITTVAPVGIAIMGVFLTWRYGIRFFKAISK